MIWTEEPTEGEEAQEAPGSHPQFRDCFSDDTLYTHGQQQPTHYGNDTCASIRINILMDTREGEEGAAGRCEWRTDEVAIDPRRVRVGWCGSATGDTLERKQRDSAEKDRAPSLVNNAN